MSSSMQRCAECGCELPLRVPAGLCPQCALQSILVPARAEPPFIPRLFGDYELLEEVARGGMGVVFKARQLKLDRIVAVKMILSGQFAGKDELLRFHAEAESAARLQHPNIVRIHETGEVDGQPYFSMDYVDGGSLAGLVREKPLPPTRAASYVKTIAHAIHYAHEQGILHRDLKPSNVLIDQADQPHVTDFGLARRMTKESFLTVTGDVMGSPGFMPPEQAGAKGIKAGRYSDVYGLGAILFYLLTGRPPFVAESAAEALHHVLDTEPVSPRLLNPSVPQDIATICLKCLEKEPAKRYRTMQQLAEELGRFLNDEPIHAHPVNRMERTWRWCRRKPLIAGMAAGIVLLAFIGLAGWLVAKEKAAAATRAMVDKLKANEHAARETKQTAEILRANDEFLLRQVLSDTNNSHAPALLKALDEAISRQPTDLALWRAKTEVLRRANRLEDALDNLSKAIDRASTDTNVPSRLRIQMLLTRSVLLRQLSHGNKADLDYSEAGRINCERNRVPARDPQARPELLDLSPFFESPLPSFLNMLSTDGGAADTIREDVKRNTGVEFDLRGGMSVDGPKEHLLAGIAVNRRFVRLHVLHSVWGSAAQDAKVAVYVLHYTDGQSREIPIRYGQHVRDVWRRDPRPVTGAFVAWRGESSGANKDSRGVQLFKATWENPRPEVEVRTIDLSRRSDNVYPILLGITVEEAEPGSAEFWMTKAKEIEEQGDLAGASDTLDHAIRQLPKNPILWESKGKLFEGSRRTNEAFDAYTRAIETAADDTNAFLKVLTSALLERSSLLIKMGRFDEAGIDNCRARRIPTRDPKTPPEMLDLSRFYNASLGFFLPSRNRESTDMLTRVAQQNTGVAFDGRGIVMLDGKGPERDGVGQRLQSVHGIPINRRLTRLHVMQGASYRDRGGNQIGYYVLYFADGQRETLPIIYGQDVSAEQGNRAQTTRAKVAWPGTRTQLPIFTVSWMNPRPDVEIKSLDFVSVMSESSPLLVAITVE